MLDSLVLCIVSPVVYQRSKFKKKLLPISCDFIDIIFLEDQLHVTQTIRKAKKYT